MCARFVYRFLIRCAALILALAVVQHRSPRLGTLAPYERIKPFKRRPRAINAVLLRIRSEAERPATLAEPALAPVLSVSVRHRVELELASVVIPAGALPRESRPQAFRRIPRMGGEEPPRA